MGNSGDTYCVLHTRYEYLLRVEPLAMLPVYPGYANGMFRAYCPAQRREVVVRSSLVACLVFVQRERPVEEDQASMVLLVQQEKRERSRRNISWRPAQLLRQPSVPTAELAIQRSHAHILVSVHRGVRVRSSVLRAMRIHILSYLASELHEVEKRFVYHSLHALP